MAATDRNSFAEVWDQLDAKHAERVRVTEATALGDEEIVRRWPQIGEGYLSKCMTALSLFTDASNSKPQLWVKDPVVGREVFPGIYRMVTVDVDVQKPGLKGIIQTLRKGFATAPQWSEARLDAKVSALSNAVGVDGISGTTSDPVDRVFDVLFPNCSPLAIESIADSLRTADYSSGITVRGELHAGAWHVLSVSTKLGEDGSASATLRIATPQYTINAYDDYGLDRAQDVHYVMDVPKEQAQGIVTAWKAANPIGASATISYSRDQKLVDITLRKTAAEEDAFTIGLTGADCRYLETETIYLNVSSPSLYPISAPTNGAGVSYTRNVTRNINGTWDIEIKTRTARYRDSGNAVVEVSAAQSTQQRQQLGVTTQGIETLEETPGIVKSQRIEIRDDCSKDVVTNTETGKEQINTAKAVSAGAVETTTEKTYQAAPLSDPAQEDGHIKSVRNVASKYPGKYETTATDKMVNPLQAVAKSGGPLVGETVVTEKNANADLSTQSAGEVGTIVDAASTKNEAGRFDNTLTTRTAKPKSDTMTTGGPLVTELTTISRNGEFPKPGIGNEGEIKDASAHINDFGKVDSTVVVRKAVERQKAFNTGGPLVTEEVVVTKNGSVANPGVGAVGEVRDASNSINEFGKVDSTKVVRRAVEVRKTYSVGGGLSSEQVTVTKNGSVPSPGTGGSGVITDATGSLNEFGMVDSVVSVKTAKTAETTFTTGGPLVAETTTVTKNGSAKNPGVGVEGTIKDASNSPNEFGMVDSVQTVRVAIQKSKTSITGSPLVTETTVVTKNGEVKSPGPGAAGTITDASNDVNEFGKVDSVLSTKVAKSANSPLSDAGGDIFESEQNIEYKNASPSMAIQKITGKVVDSSSSLNEFGLKDVSVRITTPIGVSSGPYVIHDDGYKKTTKKIYRNQDVVPAVITDDNGHEIDIGLNRFGKLDVVETRTTVSQFDVDIDEPTIGGQAPRYQRICYGLDGNGQIQPKVDLFKAKVLAQTDHQYRITASVSRDSEGFYILSLTANPKDSGSGGGAADWERGIDLKFPYPVLKYSNVTTTTGNVIYTNSRATAQAAINAAGNNLVDYGAAGKTGAYYIGRGRYKIVINLKAS